MKKIFLCFFTILMMISFSSCSLGGSKELLKWNMYESQVRKIENIPGENQTIDLNEWSWIDYDNKEIFGITGKLTYNFENSKLTDINFTPNQINNVDEMNKIYDVLKENVTLEYGNPNADEIRESDNGDLQYHYTEWNTENTLIMLQDNEKALHISLGFHSTEYLKSFEETQTEKTPVNEKANYKTKGDWALNKPYAFAVENDTYNGDVYSSGDYTFKVTNTTLGEAPIYDIYIEKSEYNSLTELGSIDYTVGGAGSFPINITLSKGDYVYVVPYSDLLYEPKGYLTFEMKD